MKWLHIALVVCATAPRAVHAHPHADAVHPVEPLAVVWLSSPAPATLFPDLQLRAPTIALPPTTRLARPHPLAQPLDLSLHLVRLAVHGDGQPGLSTFLGTSTASLGGFRLRF